MLITEPNFTVMVVVPTNKFTNLKIAQQQGKLVITAVNVINSQACVIRSPSKGKDFKKKSKH